MAAPLAPGLSAELTMTVTPAPSADALGNRGVVVFATPFKATVIETDGKRVLFAVEAWDEVEKIAEGRHERFIVGNLERFLERATKKGKP